MIIIINIRYDWDFREYARLPGFSLAPLPRSIPRSYGGDPMDLIDGR